VRVRDLVPEAEWSQRYDMINEFEQELVEAGHHGREVLPAHQPRRAEGAACLARLDDPTKLWSTNPGDVDERKLWPRIRSVRGRAGPVLDTGRALVRDPGRPQVGTATNAITQLLIEALERVDPQCAAGRLRRRRAAGNACWDRSAGENGPAALSVSCGRTDHHGRPCGR